MFLSVLPVSVIIPTYNRDELVVRAINSVLHQGTLPAEILVVDDGSTSNDCQKLQSLSPMIRVIRQNHLGVSAARNVGIENASQPWIALLDSDDTWLPQKLAQQWQYIQNQPQSKLIHCDEIWIRHGRRVNPMRKHQKGGGDQFRASLERCVISPSAVLIHRDVFDAIGLFDEQLMACEDYDLWLRYTARFHVEYIATALVVKYDGHPDQLSRKYWGMDRFRIQALEKIIQSSILSTDKRRLAIDTLLRKINIFLLGARKRGHTQRIQYYEHKLKAHQQRLS